jgi:hypothetical protein
MSFGQLKVSMSYYTADLIPGTSYYMRVAAMTVNGTGPFTTWLTHSTLPLPGNYGFSFIKLKSVYLSKV